MLRILVPALILSLPLLARADETPLPAASPSPSPAKVDRAFDPSGFDEKTLRAIAERGSIVMIDYDSKGALQLVTAGIVVDAPPADVYAIVSDFDHMKEFMPQVEESKIVKTKGDLRDVDFELKFKFSVITSTMKYTARFDLSKPDKITFDYVAGDLKSGGGAYVFLPLENGTKTLLFYSTISDLRSMGFLTRALLKEQPAMEPAIHVSSASVVVKAIQKRVEQKKKDKK